MSAPLELWKVSKSFPGPSGPASIVEDFDLALEPGEFVTLIGHSGCGKSTVLMMVAGLVPPTKGGIMLHGREIDGPGPDRGVVFQAPCLLPWLSALDNVMLGVDQVLPTWTAAGRRRLATDQLVAVGLGDSIHKRPAELSQGMRQRVGLARAFALRPKMLLLDEPFGMLDSLTRLDLQGVLMDLWSRERLSALMVTHDVDEALLLSDRVVMMTNGPSARVGEILSVPFPRPRVRDEVMAHPDYDRLRSEILGFLETRSARRPAPVTEEVPVNGSAPPGPVSVPVS